MARWFLAAFVLALVPLVAVISHPELRLVLRQDVTFLWWGDVDIAYRSFDTGERRALLEAHQFQGEDASWKRLRTLVQLARRTGKLYLYAEALRYASVAPLRPQQEPPSARTAPRYEQSVRKKAQEAVSLSDEMSRKDPSNAFPYLVKAGALFALQRPDEAVDTFLQAARCPRYEEYLGEMLAVLAPRELAADSRFLHFMAVIFPHLSNFRESARYIRQLADEAEKRGDHARAVQLGWAIITVGGKLRDSGETVIQSLVGTAIQRVGWNRHNQREGNNLSQAMERLSNDFAAYARQHGREDVARLVVDEARESIRYHRLRMHDAVDEQGSETRWYRPFERILSLRGAGVVILTWVFSMAFCLGAALIFHQRWYHQRSAVDRIAPWTAALIVGGVFVAVTVAGLFELGVFGNLFRLIAQTPPIRAEWLPQPFVEQARSVLHALAAAVLGLLAFVCFVSPIVRFAQAHSQPWMSWGLVCGLLVGLLLARWESVMNFYAVGAAVRDVAVVIIAGGVFLLGAAGLLASPVYALLLRKPLPVPLRTGIVLLWGTASLYAWQGYLAETAFWLLVGILLWTLWGRGLSGAAQVETQQAVYRFGMSALILAVLGLWLYGALGYASLPTRAAQHASIEQVIAHGENSLLLQTR